MAKPKKQGSKKLLRAKGAGRSSVRDGGTRLHVHNSGLGLWLYDDANREVIRRAGAADSGFGCMPPRFEEQTRQGLIVGYSPMQDDDLDVAVYVGEPLSESELSAARWLESQQAFLRLPSGRPCVESSDKVAFG